MSDTEGRELQSLKGLSRGFDFWVFQRGKHTVILDLDFLYGTCSFVPPFDLASLLVFDSCQTVSYLGPLLSIANHWVRCLYPGVCFQFAFLSSSKSPACSLDPQVQYLPDVGPILQHERQNTAQLIDRFSSHCYQSQYSRKYLGMFMMECIFMSILLYTHIQIFIYIYTHIKI